VELTGGSAEEVTAGASAERCTGAEDTGGNAGAFIEAIRLANGSLPPMICRWLSVEPVTIPSVQSLKRVALALQPAESAPSIKIAALRDKTRPLVPKTLKRIAWLPALKPPTWQD
jgi:hypothetical protein